jgi:hypothetical protein
MTTATVKQRTPTEILKAIGAKHIPVPAKLGKHHLMGEAEFSGKDDRRLAALLYLANGGEHLKGINMDYVLKNVKQGAYPASYYELDAAQEDAVKVALRGEPEADPD